MVLIYCFLAFSCFSSVILSAESEGLTNARKFELHRIYDRALRAIEQGNLGKLNTTFASRAKEVDEALESLDLESLLFRTIVLRPKSRDFISVFEEFGVEVGGSKAFRIASHRWGSGDSQRTDLGLFEYLVRFGLVQLEDLWLLAINGNDENLFNWLLTRGAEVNHLIIKARNGFISVAGKCHEEGRFEMLKRLLELGVDVNAPSSNRCKSLWDMSLAHRPNPLLSEIAARTDNLFTIFDRSLSNDLFMEFSSEKARAVEQVLIAELEKRIKAGLISLTAFDSVDERGWRLLDRVTLTYPRYFLGVARILLSAGLPSNFPLFVAQSLGDSDRLRSLITSGTVDLNEQPYPEYNILIILIKDPTVDSTIIEAMIDAGAEVNFRKGSYYINAYTCATSCRAQNPLPSALIEKIKSKLQS